MAKILVVEDDREINQLLCTYLKSRSYETVSAQNGLEALNLFHCSPDISLVLLDIMLPLKSGDSVLQKLREQSNVPVIIISAKGMVQTKIDVMRMGADDYITKPFDLDEVLVRIEAVLRRSGVQQPPALKETLVFKDLVLNTVSGEVTLNGHEITLTGKEYRILELLLRNPDKLFSKANLFESVWNEPYFNTDTSLKVHMSNLRSKLKQFAEEEYIETVYGMGYRLKK
ncbi:MAG: response regulator transcription factor [Lachnospiraceae bacterium]|nr:response regulator transcription factor [Lachnospiraceae bacterium]